MGTDSTLPSLAHLCAPSSSEKHTTLSIDVFADVNNMKNLHPHDSSVTPAVAVQSPHPKTPSFQADAMLTEDKFTLKSHAYSKARVIKP
jgi:hypothetical protein